MDVDLRVLGPLDAYVRGQRVALGGPKQRTVLAVLVQAVGERVSTDSLLHGLYGDDLPPRGRRTVQTYVSNLRRDLGDAVRPVDRGYVLDVDPAAVDAVRFEQAVRTAVELLPDDPEAAARLLTDALGWWRGHAYADIEPVGAIAPEVTRLAELRLDAIETRIEADLACGRHADVLPELRSLTSEHPLRERLHAQHMLALYRSDRQADALRVYGEVRATLVDQVGVEPGPSLQSLEQRILVQDPGLDLARHRVERRSVLVCDLDPVHWDRPGTAALLRHRDDLITARDVDGQATIAVHGTATVVTFPDVADALGLATVLARDGGGLRIALDHGDVERGAGDEVTGPPVTRAARILALAHPGQVLLTDAAHGALATSHRTGWTVRSLGAHEVAGLADRLAIYELADEGLPGPFPPLRTDRLPPPIAVDGTGSLPGYELRERLGGNVLGDVHRAYQPAVGREVAIRVLNPAVVAGPDFVRRFEVEAQRMARLHHPHLVGLLDYWRDPTGAFLVHPLVSGRPLTIVAADGTMTPRRVLALLERLAAALEHAHRHGLVHGRLRADNVVIDDDGSPWLCDLGLAQLCAGAPGAFVHDLAAPEVFDGAPATPRTDVHDLGVLAHHLLAGTAPPPDGRLPSVGSAPDDVLARATAPDPRGRQPSVTDMVAELHLALGKQPSHRSSVATRNPYRGLATFQEVDAPDFHGRGALVGELVDALRSHRLVVVVGPSGVGKSSVVRAGLIPTLRSGAVEGSQDWVIADCSPGDHPVDRLATALRGVAVRPFDGIEDALTSPGASLEWIAAAILPPDTTLLLLVDQFEELFTGTTGEAERRAVLDLLTRIANGDGTVHVVLTLRA